VRIERGGPFTRTEGATGSAGWHVVRFTARDVGRDPGHVTTLVRTLLEKATAGAPALGAAVRP